MIHLTEKEFEKLKETEKVFPLVFEANGDELTPIIMFYNLNGKNRCLLESGLSIKEKGRYSFMAENPYLQVKSNGKNITIVKEDGIKREREGDVIEVVRDFMPMEYEQKLINFPFIGGAIGYIGYDMIRQYEILPNKNKQGIDTPETYLLFYKTIICYDHYVHKIYIIYNVFPQDSLSYKEIKAFLESIHQKLKTTRKIHPLSKYNEENKNIKSNLKEKEYYEMVKKAKQFIKRGDIFQVVLSQRFTIETEQQPFEVYRRLRSNNPSPYLFYIEFGDFEIVGSSPERLVSIVDQRVITNPIAGTRPRGKTQQQDEFLAKELLADEKERAEHVMLLDLGRNDVGKVSELGSVKVDTFMEIEFYSHVMHLVSEVTGRLKKGLDCFDALKACLPAGTVSGAPKIRAMEIIEKLENTKRGIYAGGVGYFSYQGNMDVCIAIRSAIFKDNKAYLQAGAGIVYDSDPRKEYQEIRNKAEGLKVVI